MTVHKLSAGDGYTYYTREVASGDELRPKDRALGEYYHLSGYPPGQWGGHGAKHLEVTGEVTEEQMQLLFGEGLHPRCGETSRITGEKFDQELGQRYKHFTQKDNVLAKRITTALGDFERLQHRAPEVDERRIIRTKTGAQYFRELHGRNPVTKEELGKFISHHMHPASQAVAGFDLVFSPPKSVSYLWGVGEEQVRVAIEKAHYEAIESTMNYLENTAVYTRRGKNGIRQQDVDGGLIYTRFRHHDSRDGDPQLHDHVVVSNKVLGTDNKWGTLDGALLYQFNVAASEHYNRRVLENTCQSLGLTTTLRQIPGKRPITEIAGIDVTAIEAASSRRGHIHTALADLARTFEQDHGYEPNRKQLISLSQQATLATRASKKQGAPLAELVQGWKHKFGTEMHLPVGPDALRYAQDAARSQGLPAATNLQGVPVFEPSTSELQTIGLQVIRRIESERAVWGEHHVLAETTRQLGALAGTTVVPDTLVFAVTRGALEDQCLCLSPDYPVPEPVAGAMTAVHKYQRPKRTLYTSTGVLEAEHELLSAAQHHIIPAVARERFHDTLEHFLGRTDEGQQSLAEEFCCSDKLLTTGIGPAGAGKTTAMRLVVAATNASGGKVLATAPTASAAALLGREIGAEAMTLDAFVLNANQPTDDYVPLKPGDMLLIDEAGMVGTGLFTHAVNLAAQYGAVIRAIGDDRQLGAIGCGGTLRLIDHHEPAARLETVHRFRNADGTPNDAEAAASLAMREAPLIGTDAPWDYYWKQQRIMAGDTELMQHHVFAGWQKDQNSGYRALMIAPNNALVGTLNDKAQTYRIQLGELNTHTHGTLSNGSHIYEGDIIVSRRNDRRLVLNRGHDFVKNNDVWTVTHIHTDGSLNVQHRDHHGTTTLPPAYVRQHVELGYASTIHRAQGMTYDSAHALLVDGLDRAQAYVATSRGRYSNQIYVALETGEQAPDVLEKISHNTTGSLTAHDTAIAERARSRSLEHLGAIHRDLVDQAREQRLQAIFIAQVGEETAQSFIHSPAWGAVITHLGVAEDHGLNVHRLIQDAFEERAFDGARDYAAIMAWRLERLMESREELLTHTDRPMKDVSTEHLYELSHRALQRQHNIQNEPTSTPTSGILPWRHRIYGHLSDHALSSRITQSADERDKQIPSDPNNRTETLTWELETLNHERNLRETMPESLQQAETFERDHTTRLQGAGSIANRITNELKLRDLLDERAEEPATDMPEWFTPTKHLSKPETPTAWVQQIQQYRGIINQEFTRVGAELAENPPAWLSSLGPVPRRSDRHQEWCHLAAEIQAYRHTYNIPDSEPHLVPKEHHKNPIAQDFTTRATALHKHSKLTTRPPLTPEERTTDRLETELAVTEVVPTAAEAAIAELRRRRNTTTDQPSTPETPVEAPAPNHGKTSGAGEEGSLQQRLEQLHQTQHKNARKHQLHDETVKGPDPEGPRLG